MAHCQNVSLRKSCRKKLLMPIALAGLSFLATAFFFKERFFGVGCILLLDWQSSSREQNFIFVTIFRVIYIMLSDTNNRSLSLEKTNHFNWRIWRTRHVPFQRSWLEIIHSKVLCIKSLSLVHLYHTPTPTHTCRHTHSDTVILTALQLVHLTPVIDLVILAAFPDVNVPPWTSVMKSLCVDNISQDKVSQYILAQYYVSCWIR